MNACTHTYIHTYIHRCIQTYILAKGRTILIAADTNSRSTTWHDIRTNSRGMKLEEYLANKQLHIINEESERFTFHNSIGSSNIDLTITNSNLLAAINEWEVTPD